MKQQQTVPIQHLQILFIYLFLLLFLSFITYSQLFFFYHGQSDIFEVIDINKLTMHKNANFLITTTF